MFDNSQDSESDRRSFQEAIGFEPMPSPQRQSSPKRAAAGFLGMSAAQRLVVALLLLFAVCALGTMCLLATGRISAF